jgi:flagellar basal-body rod protein FlgB
MSSILDDTPLESMLKSRLTYVNQRQRLISENIANADTPGYTPRDLKPFDFAAMVKPQMAPAGLEQTHPLHLAGKALPGGGDRFRPLDAPDSETRLDGNQVVLEEEMNKMTESRVDYETVIDFYQQVQSMISAAAKAPGKSS